jgi:hypothetical protein
MGELVMGGTDGLPTEVFVLAMMGIGNVYLSLEGKLEEVRMDEGRFVGLLEEGAKLHCSAFIFPYLIITFLAFVGFCL